MTLENVNEIGKTLISNRAFQDIAEISALKVSGVHPVKKNDFAEVKEKDGKLAVNLHVKITQNIDIVKTCAKVQTKVREALEEMLGMEVANVNIDIQGFVAPKKKKEENEQA